MGVTNSNKVVNTTQILCDGTVRVTLALTATPDIMSNPTDIVLVLDRSGSMAGVPLANMKAGADTFIDIIADATGGSGGQIGSGSRIGIVSFADTATADTGLITSVDTLKAAVDALTAGGSTNHADAFATAAGLLDPPSGNARVIVMFTDGNTTAGGPAAPGGAAARAQGIIIYCIGLVGSDGVDVSALNEWASDPDAAHVAVTPDAADLEQLFADLAANISNPGATDIVIDETVQADFAITSILTPSKGSAALLDARSLRWTIPELGVTASESAILEFLVQHTGQISGDKLVNQSITYSDAEGNVVTFPAPTVSVDCGTVVYPEPCPTPVELSVSGCSGSVEVDLGDVSLDAPGQILQVDVTLQQVCPGQRVALAAILSEVDSAGVEHDRGMKVFTIPAHDAPSCRDVLVRCIRFVLPADPEGTGQPPCAQRDLRMRFIANSLDNGFLCCADTATP